MSTITLHDPLSPTPHPSFVPYNTQSSRSTSIRRFMGCAFSRVRLPLRLNIMIAKASHEGTKIAKFSRRSVLENPRGSSWSSRLGEKALVRRPLAFGRGFHDLLRRGRDLAQIDPDMPQRIDDGRRRAIDRHLANALGAKRAVFVRIVEHHDVDRRRIERRRNDVV